MNTNTNPEPLTPEQRARAAREQLRDALAPVGRQENSAVEHMFRCVGDLPTLETVAMMVDRAITEVAADTQRHAYRSGVRHVLRIVAEEYLKDTSGFDDARVELLRSWAGLEDDIDQLERDHAVGRERRKGSVKE